MQDVPPLPVVQYVWMIFLIFGCKNFLIQPVVFSQQVLARVKLFETLDSVSLIEACKKVINFILAVATFRQGKFEASVTTDSVYFCRV